MASRHIRYTLHAESFMTCPLNKLFAYLSTWDILGIVETQSLYMILIYSSQMPSGLADDGTIP